MNSTVRCKVQCLEASKSSNNQLRVTLTGVYSDDPNSENKWFARATPVLNFSMTVENESAFPFFEQGAEYYLDMSRAPVAQPAAPPVTDPPPAAPIESPPAEPASTSPVATDPVAVARDDAIAAIHRERDAALTAIKEATPAVTGAPSGS